MTTTQARTAYTLEQSQLPSIRFVGRYSARPYPVSIEAGPTERAGWIQSVSEPWPFDANAEAWSSYTRGNTEWTSGPDTVQRIAHGNPTSKWNAVTAFSVGDLERDLLELLDTAGLRESHFGNTEAVSHYRIGSLLQDVSAIVWNDFPEGRDLIVNVLDTIADDLLRDVLNDLDQVVAEAIQDGFPIPADDTVEDARDALNNRLQAGPS